MFDAYMGFFIGAAFLYSVRCHSALGSFFKTTSNFF